MARLTISRRVLLGGCVGASAEVSSLAAEADQPVDPDRMKLAQPGDRLVDAGGDANAAPLKPDDVAAQDVTLAWPYDPQKKVVRDGSRLNMVLLARFNPSELGEKEKPRAVDGVVAYTAICTHQQCWATDWLKSIQVLQCPCHQSRYDLRHGAKVVDGPAPRPLPALPLRANDGVLVVAGAFTDRVGGTQQQGA